MRKRFHGLKRLKIRQSWNKYNLYNISRAQAPKVADTDRTFFQQKWTAKALTRAYHGETVREKHWQNMFRRSIRSVVSIEPFHLARTDGSDFASGRGSGLQSPSEGKAKSFPRTPYMNMVYAPLERRLDTAIFRALFASSTRQARQFVVHGYVKVNGKKMIYPGYQLNPGDMFQVEPERVLYATGAPKDARERRAGRLFRRRSVATNGSSLAEPSPSPEEPSPPPEEPSSCENTPDTNFKEVLTSLIRSAKAILGATSTTISAKRKQDLRTFKRNLQKTLSRQGSLSESLDPRILELASSLGISSPTSSSSTAASETSHENTPAFNPKVAAAVALSKPDASIIREALITARENPIDDSKPYATPWRPREWMSAFAFVPRYLEVHHKICSAVYIRHPVARPGLAEVPTPYGLETNALAFNWYLRRR